MIVECEKALIQAKRPDFYVRLCTQIDQSFYRVPIDIRLAVQRPFCRTIEIFLKDNLSSPQCISIEADDFQPGVNFPCDSEHGLLHPVIDTRGLLGGLTTSPKENLQSPYEKRRFLFKTLPGLNDGCRRIILHWLLELSCIPKSNIPSTNGSFECQFGATPGHRNYLMKTVRGRWIW